MEGKHTFESKAKAIDQSERTVQPHMVQRPTNTCNQLRIAPVHTRQTQGSTRKSPCQRKRGVAAWLGRSSQFRHNRLTSSTCCPLIGSQWRFQVTPLICRPRDPCATPINMKGGGGIKSHLKLLSLKFLSCLVHRLVEFRLK
jgi:hypothetical protein